jgi:hypothetical protein
VFALVVRYVVGRQENAELFVEEVIRGFDQNGDVPGVIGSLLLTRAEDGEALQLLLFETAEAATAAEAHIRSWPTPQTGAREVVRGRRADVVGHPHWEAWQGRWNVRADRSDRSPSRTAASS